MSKETSSNPPVAKVSIEHDIEVNFANNIIDDIQNNTPALLYTIYHLHNV